MADRAARTNEAEFERRADGGDEEEFGRDADGEGERGGGGDEELTPGRVLVACEKLFGGGRGVRRFPRTRLRYVELPAGARLVEQNPDKQSEWAELARRGRRVAWVMRDGEYLARVIDGEVVMLKD